MTAINSMAASSAVTASVGQGAMTACVQRPRPAQQCIGHSLEQRGMHGKQPAGLQQGAASSALHVGKQQMEDIERTNSAAMSMNAQFNAQKTLVDTLNGILGGMVDSATKASNACSEAAKGIKVQ